MHGGIAMKRVETEERGVQSEGKGINRRDVLKIMGAGALLSLLPGYGLGGSASTFSPSKGQGLIFLVGDGMPLGVIGGCMKSGPEFMVTRIRFSTQG
jgi:hypothetical protein